MKRVESYQTGLDFDKTDMESGQTVRKALRQLCGKEAVENIAPVTERDR